MSKIRFLIFSLISACQVSALAQVNYQQISCNLTVPVTVKFEGAKATVTMRGNKFILPFYESWVSPQGELWSDYQSKQLLLSTTLPNSKYVSLKTFLDGKWANIAHGYCD